MANILKLGIIGIDLINYLGADQDMGKKSKFLIVAILVAVLISSCGKALNPNEDTSLNKKPSLTVYTSHKEEVYGPIIDEFQTRTGIWVQVVTSGTNELLDRIEEEKDSPLADVLFGGGIDSLDASSELFQAYVYKNSEILIDNYKSDDDRWTIFSQLPVVFVYNNKLVYEPEAPKSWHDLMTDRWQGKIAFADPSKSGSAYTILNTFMQVVGDKDLSSLDLFYKALNGKVLDNSGDVLPEVSSGTKLVGITLEETALKMISSGGDIGIVYPSDGTSSVPDGSAIIANAPNPENAILFMDFILGEDVQKKLVNTEFRRSVRKDLQVNKSWFKEEIKLIDFDLKWAMDNRNPIIDKWNSLTR